MSRAHDVVCLSRAILASTKGMVAVFSVYLDESGTHDGSPVVTVAACLARPEQWGEFTTEWLARPIHGADVRFAI